jgi:hypothetical protein
LSKHNKYKSLIEACGMSPKGASRVLNLKHAKSRQWACGVRETPIEEYKVAVDKLSRISLAIKEITGERK